MPTNWSESTRLEEGDAFEQPKRQWANRLRAFYDQKHHPSASRGSADEPERRESRASRHRVPGTRNHSVAQCREVPDGCWQMSRELIDFHAESCGVGEQPLA